MSDLSYQSPPSGFPMPQLKLALILVDINGKLYVDERGYLWRGPEYRARYDVLAIADPVFKGGYTPIGNWFRSQKQSAEYAPSAPEQIEEYINPLVRAGTKLAGSALLLGGIGAGLWFGVPYLMKRK